MRVWDLAAIFKQYTSISCHIFALYQYPQGNVSTAMFRFFRGTTPPLQSVLFSCTAYIYVVLQSLSTQGKECPGCLCLLVETAIHSLGQEKSGFLGGEEVDQRRGFSKNNGVKISGILISCFCLWFAVVCTGSQDAPPFSWQISLDKAIQRVNLAKYLSGFYQPAMGRKIKVILKNKVETHTPFLSKKEVFFPNSMASFLASFPLKLIFLVILSSSNIFFTNIWV